MTKLSSRIFIVEGISLRTVVERIQIRTHDTGHPSYGEYSLYSSRNEVGQSREEHKA